MPRMRIVNASEQAQLETPPIFSSAERKYYLYLPKSLMEIAESLHSSSARIGFALMCGYFRASKRFFMPTDFRIRDIEYAAVQFDLAVDAFSASDYAKATRFRHQQIVLDFFGFRAFDQEAEILLETEITTMVRAHLKPRLIFARCLDVLVQNKVQIPGTRRLTDIIRSQINLRKRQLAKLVETHLASSTREKLDELFTTGESESRYRLTLLKKQSQSTKPTKIRESVADFHTICILYHEIAPVLEVLDLGLDGVRYYAGSVLKSEIFQIRRRSDADRHIHTRDIHGTRAFFKEVFDLVDGERPEAIRHIPGCWLYSEGKPIVHLIGSHGIGSDRAAEAIDHVGIRMTDYSSFRSKLDRLGIHYSSMDLADIQERRLFLHAPGGPLLEAVFSERVPREND